MSFGFIFGWRLKIPVIAVAGAIGAVAVAGSAVAATAGGIAAISAITAFEVVAAVGATVGAIGAVTKNKTLSMVGLAVGAIGGVGALASSAGLFGAEAASGASLFGSSTPAASNTFAEGLTPATAGASAGDGAVDAGTWTSSVADAASDGTIPFVAGAQEAVAPVAADVAPPTDLTTLSTTSENVADPARELATEGTKNPLATDQYTFATQSDPSKVSISSDASNPSTYGQTSTFPTGDATGATAPATEPGTGLAAPNQSVTGKVGDIFGKIATYAGDHPVAALGVLQAGASLFSGATNTLTPAQVAYYNANAANNNAAAALAQRQLATMAQPKAAATLSNVTGSPGPIIPQTQGGLINAAPPRQALAPVSGVPS